jgi:hypothetical protein
MCDDFGEVGKVAPLPFREPGVSGKDTKKREYLKVFETMPPQMLNAYGPAKYAKMSDEAVWKAVCEPLKSGAVWMTECASSDPERRGIAINRFLHAAKVFCEYQLEAAVKRQNEAVIKDAMFKELYAEIDRILPSLQYCLAPKKAYKKEGASLLRASAVDTAIATVSKSEPDLDKHGKIVYEWLDKTKPSRIRMLQTWQSAAGMSFVAGVHHRALTCFRYYGNSHHKDSGVSEVSLTEFQAAIKIRHQLGNSGIDEQAGGAKSADDFGKV